MLARRHGCFRDDRVPYPEENAFKGLRSSAKAEGRGDSGGPATLCKPRGGHCLIIIIKPRVRRPSFLCPALSCAVENRLVCPRMHLPGAWEGVAAASRDTDLVRVTEKLLTGFKGRWRSRAREVVVCVTCGARVGRPGSFADVRCRLSLVACCTETASFLPRQTITWCSGEIKLSDGDDTSFRRETRYVTPFGEKNDP